MIDEGIVDYHVQPTAAKKKYKQGVLMKKCIGSSIRTNTEKISHEKVIANSFAFCIHSFRCIQQGNEIQDAVATTASKIKQLPVDYLNKLIEVCPFPDIVTFLIHSNDERNQRYVLQIFNVLSQSEIFPLSDIMTESLVNKLLGILGSFKTLHQLTFSFINNCIKNNSEIIKIFDQHNILKYIEIVQPCSSYVTFLYYYLINSNNSEINQYVSTLMVAMLPFGTVEIWKQYSSIIFSKSIYEIKGFSDDYDDVIIEQISKSSNINILKICFRLIALHSDDPIIIYNYIRETNERIGTSEFLIFFISFLLDIWDSINIDDKCLILSDIFPLVANGPLQVQLTFIKLLFTIPVDRITNLDYIVLLTKYLLDKNVSLECYTKLIEILHAHEHPYHSETKDLLSDMIADISDFINDSDDTLSILANCTLDLIN